MLEQIANREAENSLQYYSSKTSMQEQQMLRKVTSIPIPRNLDPELQLLKNIVPLKRPGILGACK